MEIATLILLALMLGAIVWLALKSGSTRASGEGMTMLHQQVESLRNSIDEGQRESRKLLNEQLTESARAIEQFRKSIGQSIDGASKSVGQVRQELARLDEANKRIFEVGKSISNLEQLLKAPKLRGGLGEFFLYDLLGQILPADCWEQQRLFKSGKQVDAVVFIGDRMAPIDSKFPMESFQRIMEAEDEAERKKAYKEFARAVKSKVDDIADSYILPDENTYDFALMYIPAENVYYETIIKHEHFGVKNSIAEYALGRKVIPVSPNNLYAYLQTIVMGLRGLRIEKSAAEVIKALGRLNVEFEKFNDDFRVIGGHLGHAKGKYEETEKRLIRLAGRLEAVSQLEPGRRDSDEKPALPEPEE